MASTDISNAESSNLEGSMEDWQVESESTERVRDNSYTCKKWETYLGFYKNIPEIKNAIDAKARWSVGKGYTADEPTEILLDDVTGFGNDTFNTILENMIKTYHIAGDAFAEIIKDENDEVIVNLKPLDPSTIKIIGNNKGRIKEYRQLSKSGKGEEKVFQPDEIFHLTKDRIADEIHGQSIIQQVEGIITKRNEAMDDWQKVLHRNVAPLWIIHLNTDNKSEIQAFKEMYDRARADGENMYVPKDAVVPEAVQTANNATLNPESWIDKLNNYFYQGAGTPSIIVGNSQSLTEAAAKMEYLVWQQNTEEEQLYLEEQTELQLELSIKLNFPARLESGTLGEKQKDDSKVVSPSVNQRSANEQNDTTAEAEGNK